VDHGGGGHDHDAHLGSAAALAEPFSGGLLGDAARGRELYRANCVACHGEEGDGRGPRAYFILPKPRNFTHPASRSAYNRPHLYHSIARGKLGTEMAAWDTVLDPQSIADVAEYVYRRFIVGTLGAAGGATGGGVAATR
jgi:mono/diheme cytochrome c family protein